MSKEKGFTLIEVLIAIAILAIAITALAGLAGSTIKSTDAGKRRTQALNLAAEKLEALKSIRYPDIQTTDTDPAKLPTDGNISRTCSPLSGAPPTAICTPTVNKVTIDNMQFTWSWTVMYVDLNNDGSYGPLPIIATTDMKRIDLTVTWTDLFGFHKINIPTLRKV